MKIKNIQELKSKKEQLKAEISEIESVLSFENPRKTFGVITDGISEKYLGSFLDSNLANKILPLAGSLLGTSVKFGTQKFFENMVKKNLTRSVVSKGAIGLGLLVATPFLLRKLKKELDDYQRKETTKSLSKLI